MVTEGSIPQYFTEQNNLNLYMNSFLQKWTMATNNCEERAAIYGKWLILEKTGSTGVISLWVNTQNFFRLSTLVAVKMSFISFKSLVGFGFGVCVWEREGGVILNCRTQRVVCVA